MIDNGQIIWYCKLPAHKLFICIPQPPVFLSNRYPESGISLQSVLKQCMSEQGLNNIDYFQIFDKNQVWKFLRVSLNNTIFFLWAVLDSLFQEKKLEFLKYLEFAGLYYCIITVYII